MRRINDNSLYLVISEEYGKGKTTMEIARSAISGGVDILQMREKNKSTQERVSIGKELSEFCRKSDTTFIINDDPLLARRIGADGVHLGQEDIQKFSIGMARDTLGPSRIIGVSTHSLKELEKACGENVDYIAFGPIFPTKTKDYCIGTSDVEKVLNIATKPIFFIGGINLDNIEDLLSLGARNVALIRAIIETDDIEASARSFKEKLICRKEALGA